MIVQDPEGREIAALTALAPAIAGGRVLEIGCGDGRLTRRYSARAAFVLAADPDAAKVAALAADPPPGSVEALAAGVEALAPPPRSFDVVLLSWSL